MSKEERGNVKSKGGKGKRRGSKMILDQWEAVLRNRMQTT